VHSKVWVREDMFDLPVRVFVQDRVQERPLQREPALLFATRVVLVARWDGVFLPLVVTSLFVTADAQFRHSASMVPLQELP